MQINHQRYLHVVVIGKQWDVFYHLHPEDFGNITEMAATGECKQ